MMKGLRKLRGSFKVMLDNFDRRDIPYIAEVALYVPLLVLIHQWMLLSPDSDFWIFSVPCFVLRYGGSLWLLGILNFRRRRLLNFYVCIGPFIALETMIFSLQENVVALASGYSAFSLFRLLGQFVVLFAFILLLCKLSLHLECNMLSWRSNLLLIGFAWMLNQNNYASMVHTILSIVFATASFLIIMKHFSDNNDRFPSILMQFFAKDVPSLFGIFYYTYAILCELRNGMSLHDLVSVPVHIHIIGKWCTSFVVLHSVASVFALVGNIIISIILYCLVNEREYRHTLRSLIYVGIGGNIVLPFHGFALLSGILQVSEKERIDAMTVLLHFSLVWLFVNIWSMLQPLVIQLGANAVERRLRVHFWVLLFTSLLVLASVHLSLNITTQLNLGIWSVLCVSGSLMIVTSALFSVLEYTANMFSWFHNMDLTAIIDYNYYLSLSRSAGIIVCSLLEAYHRLFFPLFSHNTLWLIVFALILLLGQLVVAVPILCLEYERHLQRRKSLAIVMSLPRATPLQLAALDDVCAICLEDIRDGLVTPCSHIFHIECLKRACATRKMCPMCNQVILLNTSNISDDPQTQLFQIIVI